MLVNKIAFQKQIITFIVTDSVMVVLIMKMLRLNVSDKDAEKHREKIRDMTPPTINNTGDQKITPYVDQSTLC